MASKARDFEKFGNYAWILENGDVAVQGTAAGLDTATGTVRPMGSSATQVYVGTFAESKTGDGTKKVEVELPGDVHAEWMDNDTAPNDIDAANIGSEVYAKDATTVSTLSTSRSKAGRVLDYDATRNLVLVQGGLAVTGPTGASGTSGSVATKAALKAVGAAARYDGALVMVRTDGSLWRFVAASSATEDSAQDLVLTPDAGTGRWLRADKAFTIKVPFDFNTADNAVILTIPTGFVLRLAALPYYDVTSSFTGGTSSAIGIDSNVTGYTTKGDLLGGASGNVAAALTAGIRPGTVGDKLDSFAELQAFVMQAATEIHFGRITSQFSAGAGFVCLPVVAATPA